MDSTTYAQLEALFAPQSIAVIGASEQGYSPGRRVMQNLTSFGFPGRILPINPKYRTVMGHRCYRSIAEVDGPVDVATVAVGAAQVMSMLAACAAAGVRSVIIYSSGFSELGDAGRDTQEAIGALARESGMRVLGPNCQGVLNVESRAWTSWGTAFSKGLANAPSGIAVTSQSGAMAQVLFAAFERAGLGLNYAISTGNEADVDVIDAIGYCLEDPGVDVVCGYVEALRSADRARAVAARANELGKPVILLKGGRTESGARAVSSHTGALAGNDEVYRSLFRQAGLIYAEGLEEMAATTSLAVALARRNTPVVPSPTVALVTNSGGLGVMMTDDCVAQGLSVPPLDAATKADLTSLAPTFINVGNPVDLSGMARSEPGTIGRVIEKLATIGGFDTFIVPLLSMRAEDVSILDDIVRVQEELNVPILLVLMSSAVEVGEAALDRGLATFFDTQRAIRALVNLSGPRLPAPRAPDRRPAAAPSGPGGERHGRSEWHTKHLLRRHGLPVVEGHLVTDPDGAVAAWRGLGDPVVLKVSSAAIAHKTELGLVELDVRGADSVRSVFARLRRLAEGTVGSPWDGVIVEKMVRSGQEMIVGVRAEAPLGQVVVVGVGGIYTEIINDAAARLLPVTIDDAVAMIEELRAYPLLTGARGGDHLDVRALAELIVAVGEFVANADSPVVELDLNPVFVLPAGAGVRIADAYLVDSPSRIAQEPVPGLGTR